MTQKKNFVATFFISTLLLVSEAAAEIKLFGLHSDELHSGELVVPRRVNRDGDFISHQLEHFHEKSFLENRYRLNNAHDNEDAASGNHVQRRRRRRSAGKAAQQDATVHYHLDVENETLHLELEPHSYFMTPNLIIERHRRDLRTRTKPTQISKCHFHGKVRGHSDSRVAVSTCRGLVGHIKTNTEQYYIEPSKHHEAHPEKGHPHVVFRQSSVKDKKNKMKKQRKHRRKEDAKLLSSVSNCGTKEPRRRIETRLEWQSLGQVKIQEGRKIKRHHNSIGNGHGHGNANSNANANVNANRNHHKKLEQAYKEMRQKQNKFKYRTSANESPNANGNVNANQIEATNEKAKTKLWKSMNKSKKHDKKVDATATATKLTSSKNRSNKNDKIITYTTINNTMLNEYDMRRKLVKMDKRHQRQKRSVSTPRHVETLIVADSTMVGFHANDTETYLLTIMNMVSALYKDPSIGNSIEIVIVKIILLEEDEAHWDLNLTQNAQQNLNSFCRWQQRLNAETENDPYHHDVAILVTRKNICGNNCMTLGLANVGGMCNPKQSCSVNEDNGIMLSHTIAHELGHNFGMFHDSAKIGCHPRIGSIVHIMTPTFGADTLQVSWSNCSRKYITHFLDQGLGECLDDMPNELSKQYIYPEQPAGALFNAELQCRLQFNMSDSNVTACSELNEICSILWCEVNGECVTNMRPTAPGTACGTDRWCQNGKCVPNRELRPVDGGWGKWSEWSECSRACGGGVSTQHRECDNPLPKNGGLFCIGERKRYKICNTNVCGADEPNFRGTQCAKYDSVPYQGSIYKWLPHFDKDQPCKLFCTDVDDTIIANWGEGVLDGTPCTLGTNNMCIDGICKKVGCDWNIDSELEEDRCGICGGNGDKCKPIESYFLEPFNISEGYLKVMTIPAKARHIVIKELGNTQHFLAIGDALSNEFYLNGDSLISMPGEFIIAGAESLYERLDEQETISIPHPIESPITIYVIVRGKEANEGIRFEFTLPAVNETNSFRYSWEQGNWSSCSKSCGGGLQFLEPLCLRNEKSIAEPELCWKHAKNARPALQTRVCNKKKCPAVWWAGPWQFCQETCHVKGTPLPQKRRSVVCLGPNEVVTDDHHCNPNTKPAETDNCDEELPECPAAHFIDDNDLLHLQQTL